jgi:hypothetical protein
MGPRQACRVLLLAEGVYRVLLLAYPAEHRNEYGPLMVQLFRDRCRDIRRRGGNWGLVQLWGRVLKDTIITSIDEHLDELKERSWRMTRRQQILSAVCALGPLALWAGLFTINPAFESRVFTNPLGWCIAATALLLLSLGYIFQRGVFTRSNVADASHLLVRKPALRIAALGGTIVFLVLPALILIVLGPAIVTFVGLIGR